MKKYNWCFNDEKESILFFLFFLLIQEDQQFFWLCFSSLAPLYLSFLLLACGWQFEWRYQFFIFCHLWSNIRKFLPQNRLRRRGGDCCLTAHSHWHPSEIFINLFFQRKTNTFQLFPFLLYKMLEKCTIINTSIFPKSSPPYRYTRLSKSRLHFLQIFLLLRLACSSSFSPHVLPIRSWFSSFSYRKFYISHLFHRAKENPLEKLIL